MVLIVSLVVVVAGGCDRSSSASDVAPCRAGQLSVVLTGSRATPSGRHVVLVLRNAAPQPCTMYGFVGISMLAPDGQALPTDVERDIVNRPVVEVVVAPAGQVSARLSWVDRDYSEGCVAPSAVEITPPNDSRALVAAWPDTSLVCRLGQIDVEPVHPRV